MNDDTMILSPEAHPEGGAVLNPFVIVEDAAGLLDFVTAVFGLVETPEAHAELEGGKLIHSEVSFGGVNLMVVDRFEGWPARPGLLQVWVTDVGALLERAVARGAHVVTPPTPFYGECTLGRMSDPWGNLWWLWAPAPGQPDPAWDDPASEQIFDTLDHRLREIARKGA